LGFGISLELGAWNLELLPQQLFRDLHGIEGGQKSNLPATATRQPASHKKIAA
jgi:hypothetical protein